MKAVYNGPPRCNVTRVRSINGTYLEPFTRRRGNVFITPRIWLLSWIEMLATPIKVRVSMASKLFTRTAL